MNDRRRPAPSSKAVPPARASARQAAPTSGARPSSERTPAPPTKRPTARRPASAIQADADEYQPTVKATRRHSQRGSARQSPTPLTQPAPLEISELPAAMVGRFELGELLGQGGVSIVVGATDTTLRRHLALKYLKRAEPATAERFLEEAQITAQLQHPNIVPIYDICADANGRQFLAMKRVAGQTLAAVIRQHHRQSTGKPSDAGLRDLLAVFLKVCDAVAYAHSLGVIHRDLKPQNIMVGEFGEVLVMDWGLAKPVGFTPDAAENAASQAAAAPVTTDRREAGVHTLAGTVQGTPAYMAPEQAIGGTEQTEHTDVYALGGILYTILTDCLPVEGDTVDEQISAVIEHKLSPPSARNSTATVPRELEAIVLKAMARRRRDRYQSVGEMRHDIDAFLDHRFVSAATYLPWHKLAKWVRRHPTFAASGAMAAVFVALLAMGVSLWLDAERARVDSQRQAAEAHQLVAEEQARNEKLERERLEAEHAAKQEQLRRLAQENEFTELRKALGMDVTERRNSAYDEFVAAVTESGAIDGHTQETFFRTLNPNKRDEYIAAFERFFEAARRGAVTPSLFDYQSYGTLLQLGAQRYAEAIVQYDYVLEKDPTHEMARLNRALAYQDLHEYEKALADLDWLVERGENTANVVASRASVLFAMGRFADAERDFRRAGEIDPSNSGFFSSLGNCLMMLKRYDEAMRMHDKAIAIDATDSRAYNGKGCVLIHSGQNAAAIEVFTQGIRLNPKEPFIFLNRGQAYANLRQWDNALADFDAALANGENKPDLHAHRGAALANVGRIAEALAEFDTVLKMEPDNFAIIVTRGAVRGMSGDLTGALTDFNRYLESDPNNSLALCNRCATHHRLGNLQQAFEDADRAVNLAPNSTYCLMNRGDMHRVLGRYEAALADLRRGLSIEPNNAHLHMYLAHALADAGQTAEAMQSFDTAIRLTRGADADIFVRRGDVFRALGKPDEAQRDYMAAITADPNAWEGWRGLGELRLAAGDARNARINLKKAHELCRYPNDRMELAVKLKSLGIDVGD